MQACPNGGDSYSLISTASQGTALSTKQVQSSTNGRELSQVAPKEETTEHNRRPHSFIFICEVNRKIQFQDHYGRQHMRNRRLSALELN